MKNIELWVKIGLTLAIIALGYFLFAALFKPYFFEQRKEKQYKEVKERLRDIKEAQAAYRTIKNEYAASFDSLAYVLKTGQIAVVKSIGSEGDTMKYISTAEAVEMFNISPSLTGEALSARIERELQVLDSLIKYEDLRSPTIIVTDTTYVPALETITLRTAVDSLRYIPNTPDSTFRIAADVQEVGNARVRVPVYEVVALNRAMLWNEDRSQFRSSGGVKLGSLSQASQEITEF